MSSAAQLTAAKATLAVVAGGLERAPGLAAEAAALRGVLALLEELGDAGGECGECRRKRDVERDRKRRWRKGDDDQSRDASRDARGAPPSAVRGQSPGQSRDAAELSRDESRDAAPSALPSDQDPPSFSPRKEEREGDLSAHVSRDISRAALLDALRIAYDEECHNGTATLTDLELVRCIAPRLDALCARRPADPVGLFREVLGRWLARLRARELGPSPDWLARDFGAYIDPPEQRPTVHKVLRALELPDPLDPAETEELAAQARAALVRRVEAVG